MVEIQRHTINLKTPTFLNVLGFLLLEKANYAIFVKVQFGKNLLQDESVILIERISTHSINKKSKKWKIFWRKVS